MTIIGNKGEWSEIYTLFKVLADKTLYAGNADFQKNNSVFYTIVKILRSEANKDFEYLIDNNLVIISSDGCELNRVPIQDFLIKATYLFEKIKEGRSTFEVPSIEAFMNSIYCQSLKASSSSKTDIKIKIHDAKTNQEPTLGFSIKSQLGSPSTLLNASLKTNFTYKLRVQLTDNEIAEINSISSRSKIKDRIQRVLCVGGAFEFIKTKHRIFHNNLTIIDSLLPKLMGYILLKYYSTSASKISELVNIIEDDNPLGFDLESGHPFYKYKVKNLLTDIALGMVPSSMWDGVYDATGGYLVVKEDGDILCYHVYNKNDFEKYLLQNTKLDTASSSRNNFGYIYREGANLLMDLNLQIRFLN